MNAIPRLTPESSARVLAAHNSNTVKWRNVKFRDNAEPSTREQPPHCGGCWCGAANGHQWPGKEDGEPHPRDWPGRVNGHPYRDGTAAGAAEEGATS